MFSIEARFNLTLVFVFFHSCRNDALFTFYVYFNRVKLSVPTNDYP